MISDFFNSKIINFLTKNLKRLALLIIIFYHSFCFSCITDVDVFNWKNVNLKGIRIVEFDPIKKQILGISYHYNLQHNKWYPLRASGQNPQKPALYCALN